LFRDANSHQIGNRKAGTQDARIRFTRGHSAKQKGTLLVVHLGE